MNPWMIEVPAAIGMGLAATTVYGAAYPRAHLFGPVVFPRRGAE